MKVKSIGIVGAGVVGGATARSYMEFADVRVWDVIPERRTHPFEDVMACEVIFIALPSPARPDGSCNTDIIEDFFSSIGTVRNVSHKVWLAGESVVQAVAAMVEPLELVGKHVTDDFTPTLALESLTAKHGN